MSIENFTKAKGEQQICHRWASMLGKEYFGGTRGRGKEYGHIRSVKLATGENAPTLYYQHSDGDTNYHPMPKELAPYLEAAIQERFGELLNAATDKLDASVKAKAIEALKTYKELMAAAGLTDEALAQVAP